MTRRERAEKNLIIESRVVAQVARIPVSCDALDFDTTMFDRRVGGRKPVGVTAYSEAVALIQAFLVNAKNAPPGTTKIEFRHVSWVPTQVDPFSPLRRVPTFGFERREWVCRVDAYVEEGKRCLLFSEAGQ